MTRAGGMRRRRSAGDARRSCQTRGGAVILFAAGLSVCRRPPWRSVLRHTETHSRGKVNLPPHDEVAKATDVREVEDVITTDRQGLALHCKQTNQKQIETLGILCSVTRRPKATQKKTLFQLSINYDEPGAPLMRAVFPYL